ncbi:type VI secretion system protein TssA [Roseomonas sp. PWR1]|uniref:Type VI secretion system protein TssA n=1 Tax=Roseomonas nitratireducens TaxID=2820810 RepID=A0ABS4AZN7_9PROT|nr:type VI secretion system protein TssA [Neoroseomonas nitratireducens]MBP0466762.1 type VI secretion system protein TssA [Neoroseomonas nitratireducens]
MGAGVLDVDGLLAPLSSGDGVGEDLRPDYSPTSLYQRIRTQRNDARAGERAIDGGDPDADPATVQAAWRDVKKLGVDCLSGKTKDFEIASWLTEALVRLDGLAGLADGAAVIAGLCTQYWDNGFPRLDDEDGIDGRGAPLGGLSGEGADGTVMAPIRRYQLFRRADGAPCDFFLWQRAEETAMIAEEARREARYKQGVPKMDALQNEARADVATLRATGVAARTALAAWTAMDEAITARFGGDAPSTRRVSDVLKAMIEIADKIAGPPAAAASEEAAGEEAAGEAAVEAAGGGVAAPGGGGGPRPMRTRDDAIKQLEEIAAFFRKTEPHSPLAFTLEDAVRRARMPLPDLLAEVLPDEAARKAMLNSLGIRLPEG